MRTWSWLVTVLLVNGCVAAALGGQWLVGARLSSAVPVSQRCASAGGPVASVCARWTGAPARLDASNCHWHTDDKVYWAHCAPGSGHYSFRMLITCRRDGRTYQVESAWARSPDEIYSRPANCGQGAVQSVSVQMDL